MLPSVVAPTSIPIGAPFRRDRRGSAPVSGTGLPSIFRPACTARTDFSSRRRQAGGVDQRERRCGSAPENLHVGGHIRVAAGSLNTRRSRLGAVPIVAVVQLDSRSSQERLAGSDELPRRECFVRRWTSSGSQSVRNGITRGSSASEIDLICPNCRLGTSVVPCSVRETSKSLCSLESHKQRRLSTTCGSWSAFSEWRPWIRLITVVGGRRSTSRGSAPSRSPGAAGVRTPSRDPTACLVTAWRNRSAQHAGDGEPRFFFFFFFAVMRTVGMSITPSHSECARTSSFPGRCSRSGRPDRVGLRVGVDLLVSKRGRVPTSPTGSRPSPGSRR